MMQTNTLVAVVVPVVACTGLLLWYLGRNGAFTRVKIQQRTIGPFLVMHKRHTGEYKGVGKIFAQVCSQAPKYGVAFARHIGFYYDDPADTPEDQCRARCGAIVEVPKAEGKSEMEVIEAVKGGLQALPPGFELGIFPESRCLVVDFPFYGLLSILFCVTRVYPKLKEDLVKLSMEGVCGNGSIEIYDPHNHIMHVAWSLTPRDDILAYELEPASEAKKEE